LGWGKLGLRGWEVGIDQRVRVGGFGSKSENRATGARFSRMNHGGPLRWIEGTYLGRGKPGLRGWEVGIDRRMRGGCFGLTTQNQATGARFWQTKSGGGAFFWVEGTLLWWGTLGLGWWLSSWHAEGGVGSAHLATWTLSYFSVSHSFPTL